MATAFTVRALASAIRIELDDSVDAATGDGIAAAWADAVIDHPGAPDAVVRGSIGDRPVAFTEPLALGDAGSLADRIATKVTVAAIARLRGRALMLHACAIALPDGRVIGFVGPSGKGKTTLVRQLGTRYGYVTDETLAILADGEVLPYRKPLSIGRRPGVKRTLAASELGLLGLPDRPLRLDALVVLDRRHDAGALAVDALSVVDALSAIVPETSSFGMLSHPLASLAALLERTGGARRLSYSDRADLTDVVALVEATVAAPTHEVITELAPEGDPLGVPADRFRRVADDALGIDDVTFVYRAERIAVLTGLGSAIWRAAEDVTPEELEHAVVSRLPDPPAGTDATAAIEAAVRGLWANGLISAGGDVDVPGEVTAGIPLPD